jgi:putative ABC transport system permease protein
MNLAIRDVRRNLGRFLLTTAGVSLLLIIIMGMGGIYRGLVADALVLVDHSDADLWVVQRDTRGPLAEPSRVPRSLVHRVRAVPGVRWAREFIYHTTQRRFGDRSLRFDLLGMSWPDDRGSWLPIVAGRGLAQNHFEIVADRSLGFRTGEQMRLGKESYTVVGLTQGLVGLDGNGIAVVTVADALAIQADTVGESVRLDRATRHAQGQRSELGRKQPSLVEPAGPAGAGTLGLELPRINAVVVKVLDGWLAGEVAATIGAWGDVTVHSRSTQESLLVEGVIDKARRQIGLFSTLLTAIASIIMALVLYTLTLEKLHDIALLKLLGMPSRQIFGLVLQQAVFFGAASYAIAYFAGTAIFPHFPRRVIITSADLWEWAATVLLVSVLSSSLGIWRAMHVAAHEALNG